MSRPAALVMGIEGHSISPEERAVYSNRQPAGFILFRRNVDNPAQLRALTDSLRDLTGNDDLPILIDQEGGRVARLTPPHWPAFPPAAVFGHITKNDPEKAAQLCTDLHQAMAAMLREAGLSVNCAPVLDLPQDDADPVIGDRAFDTNPDMVIRLGRAAMNGLHQGGIQSVIKHIPGHGRAMVDSHKDLPVIDTPRAMLDQFDFGTFAALNTAPWAMTGHLKVTAIDADEPVTWSKTAIRNTIRKDFDFDGVLVTDCVYMDALGGPITERAAKSVAAGHDLALACHGDPAEKAAVLDAVPDITMDTKRRLSAARLPVTDMDWQDATKKALAETSALSKDFEARSNVLDWRLDA